MAYDLAKVTDNGNQLIAQILANKSSLSIDKIDISDTQLSASTNIQTMTSISNVVQTIQANGYSKNSNSLIISTVLSNEGITADYKAWVFGIWGSDSTNGTSQLIAVITSTNSPDTVPAYSGTTPVELTYKFAIGFSNASNLSINMNSDSFATNDTVVHTTGDETIDGQKKFDTDPTDSAGNAYAKTVDVNQQLDKKVNIADMRKPASDVAGIEEVNAKQDAIAYTPADNSKVVHNSGNEEIGGQKTFDIAPIDKTTGNPYITKDGVPSIPSDVARTGQAQTFTAVQTFSIAPVINDASTDKGDNQAATMADLKSVEESAWRVLDQSNAPSTISFRGQVLYKIDDANKIIYFTTNGLITDYGSNLILINFKGIVNDLLSGHGRLASVSSKTDIDDSDISVTSTYVKNSEVLNNQYQTNVNLISYGDPGQNYAYVIYDSLVN